MRKNMHIIALILCLILTLTSCSELFAPKVDPQTTGTDVPASPTPVTEAPVQDKIHGQITSTGYENEMLNLSIACPKGWSFRHDKILARINNIAGGKITDADVAAKVSSLSSFLDMMATDARHSEMTLYIREEFSIKIEDEFYVHLEESSIRQRYADSDIEILTFETFSIRVGDRNRTMLHLVCQSKGQNFDEYKILLRNQCKYLGTLDIKLYDNTELQPILDGITALNPETKTPNPKPTATTPPATTPPATAAPVQSKIRGTITGNAYENVMLNLRIALPKGWSFFDDNQIAELQNITYEKLDDENIADMISRNGTFTDMMMSNFLVNNLVLTIQPNQPLLASLSDEQLIYFFEDYFRERIPAMGAELYVYEPITMKVGGQNRTVLHMLCKSEGIYLDEYMICYLDRNNEYMGFLVLTLAEDSNPQPILDGITNLTPETKTPEPRPTATIPPATTPPATAAPVQNKIRGTITGNIYENGMLNMRIICPNDWTFYDDNDIAQRHDIADEITPDMSYDELSKNGMITDMMAGNLKGNNMSFSIQSKQSIPASISDEQLIYYLEEYYKEYFSETGVESYVYEARTMKVGGQDHTVLHMFNKSGGLYMDMYEIWFRDRNDEYMGFLTLSLVDGSNPQPILDGITTLK